ncbi:hypothetical protein BDF22DRAFT_740841 [Syncephalis plumigaleata]|nr:hypothetical protein BDF22DRAFT_740841 [Syncephalis plumigaleata]
MPSPQSEPHWVLSQATVAYLSEQDQAPSSPPPSPPSSPPANVPDAIDIEFLPEEEDELQVPPDTDYDGINPCYHNP